jgi:hypothetical protein
METLVIKVIIEIISFLSLAVPILLKINLIENKALEIMRRVDRELTPLTEFHLLSARTKTEVALLKLRIKDLEKWCEKQGFVIKDVDEDSFL